LQIKWKTKQNSTISKQFQNPIQKSIAKTKHHQAKAVCLTIFRDATSAMRGALPIPDVWSSHVGCLTYNGKHFRFIEDKNKFNNISSYIGTRTESDCQWKGEVVYGYEYLIDAGCKVVRKALPKWSACFRSSTFTTY
jgi:hypothetical protein